ncbi:MAG: hypothetical protein JOZ43_00445 [Acidobacteriales bacterium]|nr:hypothetical protein [Terriglobales bacterium]
MRQACGISETLGEDPGGLPGLDKMMEDGEKLLALGVVLKRYGGGWADLLTEAADALPGLRARVKEADRMREVGMDILARRMRGRAEPDLDCSRGLT